MSERDTLYPKLHSVPAPKLAPDGVGDSTYCGEPSPAAALHQVKLLEIEAVELRKNIASLLNERNAAQAEATELRRRANTPFLLKDTPIEAGAAVAVYPGMTFKLKTTLGPEAAVAGGGFQVWPPAQAPEVTGGNFDVLPVGSAAELEQHRTIVKNAWQALKMEAAGSRGLVREIAALRARAESLAAFKAYVHKRLDEAGVPADPEPEINAKHGCRVEGRLNWLTIGLSETERRRDLFYARAEALEARVRELRSGLEHARGFIVRRDDAELVRDRKVLVDHIESVLWTDAKSAETDAERPKIDRLDGVMKSLDDRGLFPMSATPIPLKLECACCATPATCVGRYEGHGPIVPACDDCCGHGNEDGWCFPIADAAKWLERASKCLNGAEADLAESEAERERQSAEHKAAYLSFAKRLNAFEHGLADSQAREAKLREALEEVDKIACRTVGSGDPEANPPEPHNPDGPELASVARAALALLPPPTKETT